MEASEESSYWTPITVAQALLGIWFAASHQPWIVGVLGTQRFEERLNRKQNLHFVFLELCTRPEYVELIRSEIHGIEDRLDHETICQLPLLDSFIKESVRLNPLDKSRHCFGHSTVKLGITKTDLVFEQWRSGVKQYSHMSSKVLVTTFPRVKLPAYPLGNSCTISPSTPIQKRSMVIAL